MSEIPTWLKQNESYKAEKTNSAFLDRTLLEIGKTLHRFHKVSNHKDKCEPLIFLLFTIITIICMSVCRNMLFTYILLGVVIIDLCFMKNDDLVYVIHLSLRAFIISCIILLPSIFLNNTNTVLTVSLKVFVSASLIGYFNIQYSTDEIISCFKMLHVPDIFIMTLDMAFKYIVILSETCSEILNALKVRLIGKFKKKDRTLMNVASMTYIKANQHYADMNEAMKCRGFTGSYYNHLRFHINKFDVVMIIIMIIEIMMCIYLGGAV